MVSRTVGCERPTGQPGLGTWSGGEPEECFIWRSAQIRVLECLGWDVEGKWPPNSRSPAQSLIHHWHLIDVFNSVERI